MPIDFYLRTADFSLLAVSLTRRLQCGEFSPGRRAIGGLAAITATEVARGPEELGPRMPVLGKSHVSAWVRAELLP